MKKCVVICNPNSGKKKGIKLKSKFEEVLNSYDYSLEFKYTRYSGHAKDIITNLDDDIDLVISIGGDGTFNEIMTGNLKRKQRLLLSHIPYGTANDLGAMYGMVKDPVQNLKLILGGKEKGVDICKINNQPFVYVAGLGKFVNVAYDTPRNLKKKFGYFAYIIKAIKSFNSKTQLFELEYKCNGEVRKGLYSFILICNATRMGGINIFQDVKLDDDQFEVLLTNITSKKDIIKSLYFITKEDDISKVPGFYYIKTNHLTIKLKDYPRKDWCIDGEKYKNKTKVFDITVEHGVKMLLPRKELHKIFKDEEIK